MFIALLPAMVATGLTACAGGRDGAASVPSPPSLARAIVGIWVLESAPQRNPLAPGNLVKVFADQEWYVIQTDPRTGALMHHHGGRYTLSGTTLNEIVEYSGPSTMFLMGTQTIPIEIVGDTYTERSATDPPSVFRRATLEDPAVRRAHAAASASTGPLHERVGRLRAAP